MSENQGPISDEMMCDALAQSVDGGTIRLPDLDREMLRSSLNAALRDALDPIKKERDKLLGLFSDYEFDCPDFETAAKVWAAMRAKQIKTEEELRTTNEACAQCAADFRYHGYPGAFYEAIPIAIRALLLHTAPTVPPAAATTQDELAAQPAPPQAKKDG